MSEFNVYLVPPCEDSAAVGLYFYECYQLLKAKTPLTEQEMRKICAHATNYIPKLGDRSDDESQKARQWALNCLGLMTERLLPGLAELAI
jgi:hypothetical protein